MAGRFLKPMFDRVLVQRVQASNKIGNVFVPDSAVSKMSEGVVVAVGAGGRTSTGDIVPVNVKVGDKVLLPEFGGDKVELDKVEYTLFREHEILGIFETKK
mmetsp:Transcript_34492/g.91050  ORF Transcript_34492/g.91050 Transcript_34492/m.91050 type:complete len:101 (-) Transcript_34492:35-337(-)|eukprot:CAMPEP_0113684830 /NCGR_PEP_ID=MMETSP0038_2-20120614/14272_1 /TAXON_ID=2898 /ORGANISM="Cryptomonas paramecium" /LENGTH=100 /DNA_ID=CAMNT_0000604725 /DNA_START=34 /DNA_END=336 /DNA_ORIENTATION=+ /assembly_acc=CAM_ASM_000170